MANEYVAQEQKKFDWYQTMTNTVIEHLESGADFLDNLDMVSIPVNGDTGKGYDFNSNLLLMMEQQKKKSNDPRFFTYKQLQAHGYSVPYGTKSVAVIAVDQVKNGQGKRESHFENVFHASDVVKRVYLTDAQGNRVPLLDKDGNQRFSKRDNQPLYRYNDEPIPAEEPIVKKKAYLVSRDTSESFHSAVENTLQKVSDPSQRDLRVALAVMMVAAETNNKAAIGYYEHPIDREGVLQALNADKKEFANAVYDASCIVREYRELAWEASKQHEAENIRNNDDEDIPFGPVPETLTSNVAASVGERPKTVEKVHVEKPATEEAKSPAVVFSENMAKALYDSMKAMGVSEGEMIAAFSNLKEQGVKMIKGNSQNRENSSGLSR